MTALTVIVVPAWAFWLLVGLGLANGIAGIYRNVLAARVTKEAAARVVEAAQRAAQEPKP
jgi:hypothetical protein